MKKLCIVFHAFHTFFQCSFSITHISKTKSSWNLEFLFINVQRLTSLFNSSLWICIFFFWFSCFSSFFNWHQSMCEIQRNVLSVFAALKANHSITYIICIQNIWYKIVVSIWLHVVRFEKEILAYFVLVTLDDETKQKNTHIQNTERIWNDNEVFLIQNSNQHETMKNLRCK